jgi:hypothetical protein
MDAEHQLTDLAVRARVRLEPRRLMPVAGGSRLTPGPATGSGPAGRRALPGPGPGCTAPSPPAAPWSSGPERGQQGVAQAALDAELVVSTSKGHGRLLPPCPARGWVDVVPWRLPLPTGRSWLRRAHWAHPMEVSSPDAAADHGPAMVAGRPPMPLLSLLLRDGQLVACGAGVVLDGPVLSRGWCRRARRRPRVLCGGR